MRTFLHNLFAQCMVMPCLVSLANAQDRDNDHCPPPFRQWEWMNALTGVPTVEGDRRKAIDTLQCLARKGEDGGPLCRRAVETLFAIAKDDAEARQFMLEAALDLESSVQAIDTSCELLTFVSDESSNRAIRDRLFSMWPTGNCMAYFTLLRDAGDLPFLEWLGKQLEAFEQGSTFRSYLEQQADRVRVQHAPESLLERLRTGECIFDCSWFVLQAYRHGVDHTKIRQTVLRVLENGFERPTVVVESMGSRNPESSLKSLASDCRRFGVFSTSDVEENAAIKRRQRDYSLFLDYPTPAWVSDRIAARRAAFFHLPPTTGSEPAKP